MHNLIDSVVAAVALSPAARTNGTVNGTTVDLKGYETAIALVEFGTWTDGTHTPKLQDSPDNSVWTDVVAGLVEGAFVAVSAGGGSNTIQSVGYKGAQRYIRIVLTTSGATTGALVGGSAVRARARHIGTTA